MIETQNHGPLIVSSNYWESEYAAAGKLFVSCNAGAIRVLIPPALRGYIEECRSSKYAILSRGPGPAMGLPDAVEVLWEDETDSPFSQQWSPESFDLLPGKPDAGREWTISLWDLKKGKPHKALERKCHWRRVEKIPWLKPWKE